MDIWVDDEVWSKDARVDGEGPLNAIRFGLCCIFGSIVTGELLYLLRNLARYGRNFAFSNYLIAVLSCLIVQFITLAIAIWFAYVPWRDNVPVCIASYIRSYNFHSSGCQSPVEFAFEMSLFSSLWNPLAMAEVTSYLHFITETGTASHDAQVIKKHIDKLFIASCIVTNMVRNALWITQFKLDKPYYWESAWAFQHLCFGVEAMTLLNIGFTARLFNLAKYQNQEKVNVSLLGFRPAYHPIN
jgi:hypothetical protein